MVNSKPKQVSEAPATPMKGVMLLSQQADNAELMDQSKKTRGRPRKTVIVDEVAATIEKKKQPMKRDMTLQLTGISNNDHDSDDIIESDDSDCDSDDTEVDAHFTTCKGSTGKKHTKSLSAPNSDDSDDDINADLAISGGDYSDQSDQHNNRNHKGDKTKYDARIAELEAEIKQLKGENKAVTGGKALKFGTKFVSHVKIYKNNVRLLSNDNATPVKLAHSPYACAWCCHTYDTMPVLLPERYYEGQMYVRDDISFCSFNCVVAYNIDLRDANVSKRHVLIKKMQDMIFGDNDYIKIAPSREILQMFGGPISIDEYRASFVTPIMYKHIVPPLVPGSQAVVEERTVNDKILAQIKYC